MESSYKVSPKDFMTYLFKVHVTLWLLRYMMEDRILCGMCLEVKDTSMVSNFSEKGTPSTAVVCHALEENDDEKHNTWNITSGESVRYGRKRWWLFHGRSTTLTPI
jgi:uncharacterized UBP type Zn finger protein